MKNILIVAIAFAFCVSAFLTPALQSEVEASTPTITLYADDWSGWEGAVGVYEEEFFTDATLNPGVSVISEYPGYVDTTKGVWWDKLVCPAYGQTTTTWHFSTPIYGFGGNWDPGVPGGPGAHIAVSIDGSWVNVGEIPNTYMGQFWGFVSSEPFDSVCLSPGSYCNGAWCETYELDNMVYSSLPPSPGIKVTNWELTNLWGGLTISKVLAVMGDVSGHVIDSRFDIFIPDDDSVWLVEVKYAIGDEVIVRAVPKVEPGHYSLRVQHYIFVWSKYLDYLAQYFTLMLTCLGIPCFHFSVPEPLPEASIQEIIILDLDPFAVHVITKSETGQMLPMQLPIYGQDEAIYPWEGEGGTFLIGQCPIDILVTDKQDRRVGALYEEGVFISEVNEIEAAFYGGAGQDIQFIHLPETEQDCTVEVIGTDVGNYTLDILTLSGELNNSFSAVNIPIAPSSIHQYSIDWEALSQGEEGVTVQIDANGDGLFEDTFTSDCELTRDEFLLQTATTIDFDPDTLNLGSEGKFVTVYIELPPSYEVSQIDISSIRLNGTVPALTKPTEVGDYDSDGIPDLMVKFDKAAMQDTLTVGEEVEVTITGEVAGIVFEGSDTIRVTFTAAPPGLTEWGRVSTPSEEGWVLAPDSIIIDYAVADGGEVAYAIVYSYDAGEFHLLKSTDGAATWGDIDDALEELIDVDDGDYIDQLLRVATDGVSPDFVAVALDVYDGISASYSVHVFISNDGGATFEDADEVEDGSAVLPEYGVFDLAVSPEVAGARDIAIGGYGGAGSAIFRCQTFGDFSTAWQDAMAYDGWDDDGAFTSLAVVDIHFAPSWAADKTILVVTVADTGPYDVYLQSGTWGTTEGWNLDSTPAIEAVTIVEDVEFPELIGSMFDVRGIAGITLPLDYSGRYADKRYVWVWVNYYDPFGNPAGTIFRVRNTSANPIGWQIEDGELWLTNVSYLGYISEGKAIAGVLGDGEGDLAECCTGVQVYRNDHIVTMDICCYDWEAACKPPTGRAAMAAFYVSDDPATSKAYAVALWGFEDYDEGAWSVSFDDGDDWNQLSLVDTHIDYLSDVAVSPDCNKTMLVSVNMETGCGCDSVWLKAENLVEAEEYSGKWLRTWCGQLEGDWGLLRLAPEETTGDTVYLVDYDSDTVYWNEMETLGCWEQGTATVDDIVDLAVKDKETIYALDYSGTVAMSDDYALGWHAAVDSKVDNGWTIAVRGDDILVGGCDGEVSHSADDGETFTALEKVAADGLVTVAFDSYFDANDTIYAALADAGDDNGIYRLVIGESTDWENLGAEPYDYTGLVLDRPSRGKPKTSADTGGVLYASYVSGDTTGVARCLTPAEDLCCGGTDWDYLTVGLTSELFAMMPQALKICGCLTANSNSKLFAIDSSEYYDMEDAETGTVWSFED